jgi:hypothetical protein
MTIQDWDWKGSTIGGVKGKDEAEDEDTSLCGEVEGIFQEEIKHEPQPTPTPTQSSWACAKNVLAPAASSTPSFAEHTFFAA